MAARLRIAPAAAKDLRLARAWLLQPGSGAEARRRWEALRQAPRRLLEQPWRGRPSRDHGDYRELVVSGYRLLYRLDDGATTIDLLRVFGPGQDGSTTP